MATNTPKLTLPKPDANDNFNRAAYNALIDAIDNNVGTKTQAAESHAADSVKHVTAEDKAAWSAKASTAVATQSANGLMPAADKLALDNAQKWKLTQDNGQAITPSSVDLNALTQPGEYDMPSSGVINLPPGVAPSGSAGILSVRKRGSVSITQTYYALDGSVYYRSTNTVGAFQPWDKLVDTPQLGSVLLGNKFVDQSNANFVGKVSGSTIANPHVGKKYAQTTLIPPSDSLWSEWSTINYSNASLLDGSSLSDSGLTPGRMSQQLFSFNLIEHVQRTYGLIPGVTTAEKVAWLKSNISKLTFNWFGFGSSPSGNKATMVMYDGTTWGILTNHTLGVITKLVGNILTPSFASRIDSNGFAHFLVHADASDGTTPSVINTDYAELNVELSTGIWNNTPAFTWINATYQNSWASFDADRALKYAKDEKGTVTLRGTIKSGTVGTATPVMTLPAGFRPLESSLSIPITVSGGIGELQIQSSGAVSIASASYGASPNPSTQAHIYVRFFAGQ